MFVLLKRWPVLLLLIAPVLLVPAMALAPPEVDRLPAQVRPSPKPVFTVGPMAKAQGNSRRFSDIWGILLHSTQGSPRGDLRTLSRSKRVSAHFLVLPNGHIRQLVPLRRVAFHAGRGRLGGHVGKLNEGLIGIEVSNRSKSGLLVPFPEVQLKAIDETIRIIDRRLGRRVPIYGHREVLRLPGGWHKTDPDGGFPLKDYKKYRRHKTTAEK